MRGGGLTLFFLRPSKEGDVGMRRTVLLLASTGLVVLLASVVALGVVNTPAQAAFPGANGRIAVVSGFEDLLSVDADIYTMNPNGTDATDLPGTSDTEDARDPSWSPDGQKIAFSGGGDSEDNEIYILDLNTEQLTIQSRKVNSAKFTA